jgi:hypothetical protein
LPMSQEEREFRIAAVAERKAQLGQWRMLSVCFRVQIRRN